MTRELCKYLRRFRWLIGAYVLWMFLTTFLTSTHQAFVHPSAGVRQFAWVMESYATSVSLFLLLPAILFLGMEDNLWAPKAFWRLRPVKPRTLLAAKVAFLVLLAYVLPFVAIFLTSITAGVPMAGAFMASLDHALWVGFFATFLSGVTLITRKWSDLALISVLCVIGFVFHVACWTAVAESRALAGRFHAGAGIALGLYAIWSAANARNHDYLGMLVLFGYVLALPLATVLVVSAIGSGFNSEKAQSVLNVSLARTPGAYHLGDGLKLGYEVEASGALVLKYWYQGAQRSLSHRLSARPGSEGNVIDATRSVFPRNVRVRLEITVLSEDLSEELVVDVLSYDQTTEHRVW